MTTTLVIDASVNDQPVAGNPPRTGTTMRDKLAIYAESAPPEG